MGYVTVVVFSVQFAPSTVQLFQMCGRWMGLMSETPWIASTVSTVKLALGAVALLATIACAIADQGVPHTQMGGLLPF